MRMRSIALWSSLAFGSLRETCVTGGWAHRAGSGGRSGNPPLPTVGRSRAILDLSLRDGTGGAQQIADRVGDPLVAARVRVDAIVEQIALREHVREHVVLERNAVSRGEPRVQLRAARRGDQGKPRHT